MDPIALFKEHARKSWSTFAPLEASSASTAPRLVAFAGIEPGARVLDVACGTGVVALTAARLGAEATGVDLTPELVARARENASIMGLEAVFEEGDVEDLPLRDASFDVVVSQFGHMFAPRPEVALREMLRVLRPGGTIAFSTWPPELFVGRMLATLGRYAPAPPPGARPPFEWGDPATVRERLGETVRDLRFARDVMRIYSLSIPHYRLFIERNLGLLTKLVATLEASDPAKLAALRSDVEETVASYFEDNQVRQDYLLTRAVKA